MQKKSTMKIPRTSKFRSFKFTIKRNKNQLYFYILIHNQKWNLKTTIYNSIRKHKICLSRNLNKVCVESVCWKLQNSTKVNGEIYYIHNLYCWGILNTVKIPILPKWICRFNAIPMRILADFFVIWHFKIYIARQRN